MSRLIKEERGVWSIRLAGSLAMALAFLFPAVCVEAIVLGEHKWDDSTVMGWSRDRGDWPALTNPGANGNPDGYLRIDFPAIGVDPGPNWYDTVHTPATSLFAGNWSQQDWLQFDFWAEDTAPGGLQVRWGVDGGNTWGYVLDATGVQPGQWSTFQAPLANWQDWDISPFMSESQYLADLQAIDWVGVYIFRNGTGEENYGIDNFSLQVPEPEEWLMLGVALTVTAAALRRRHAVAVVAGR